MSGWKNKLQGGGTLHTNNEEQPFQVRISDFVLELPFLAYIIFPSVFF